ncbi:hypothetical protein FNV43_RR13337 [Rhamnella rubrinervis]|uniref:Uncharacterized protein n=1 Tax=Rhamnella rubrinervis TaxID=2594499 RepID=A0A8K0MF23_9ROSA|nr:hypothetical protein FNV43_RR13337 [Rhamnella rubrinervis]
MVYLRLKCTMLTRMLMVAMLVLTMIIRIERFLKVFLAMEGEIIKRISTNRLAYWQGKICTRALSVQQSMVNHVQRLPTHTFRATKWVKRLKSYLFTLNDDLMLSAMIAGLKASKLLWSHGTGLKPSKLLWSHGMNDPKDFQKLMSCTKKYVNVKIKQSQGPQVRLSKLVPEDPQLKAPNKIQKLNQGSKVLPRAVLMEKLKKVVLFSESPNKVLQLGVSLTPKLRTILLEFLRNNMDAFTQCQEDMLSIDLNIIVYRFNIDPSIKPVFH